ncbi:C39 family peptidase [Ruminococcaceae bacterium OttesenSCG-928-A16]|nr:C39 family peptidase [Ruminococcaceae bacterium OttesenSCG-928-A16]
MNDSFFVLKSVADFAPGAFENTAVEDGSIQLGRSGGSFILSGCYTSPGFHMGAFLSLTPSWNAVTPPGTAVEMQARVAANGQWSRWFSFGKWSPFIDRASLPAAQDEIAQIQAEDLLVVEGHAPADTAQVRIFLYSDDASVSPKVNLLAASFRRLRPEKEEETTGEKMLEIPQYSCLVRDPSMGGRIMSATALTMMMNRWGEDALPEEVARSMYDSGSGRYGNIAFLTAIAGAYGYECYTAHVGCNYLRQEVRRGHAVGVLLHYRAPALSEEGPGEVTREYAMLPELEDAVADSQGHMAVLRGFVQKDGEDFVVLNDPLARTNQEVLRKLPLKKFKDLYMGVALVLHRGPQGVAGAKPSRRVAQITVNEQEEVFLSLKGEMLPPGYFAGEEMGGCTVCYTISDGIAYASAAQKRFYYLALDEKGFLKFDRTAAAEKRITFYLIGARGVTWVGEKFIEKPPAPPEEPNEVEQTE